MAKALTPDRIPSDWKKIESVAKKDIDLSRVDLLFTLGLDEKTIVRRYASHSDRYLFGIHVGDDKSRVKDTICFIDYRAPTTIGGDIPGVLRISAKSGEEARKYFDSLAKIVGAEA